MSDFTAARKNMVDCQIHTSGVVSPAILNAFGTVPREMFVPANVNAAAYSDECVAVGQGRFLLEPALHAKMLQAAEVKRGEKVLDIGSGTGYSAAVFAHITGKVVAMEENPEFFNSVVWSSVAMKDVETMVGKLTEGVRSKAPFDLIFINGAVAEIAQALIDQLSPAGRLVTVLMKPGEIMGQAVLVKKSGAKDYSSYPLFEAGCPYLPGFEPKPAFTF